MRVHWRMPQGGERAGASRALQASLPETGLPEIEAQANFCRAAEECGIDSLLTDFGWTKPDPMLLCAALGLRTTSIGFIVAYRSGLICPTSFVHQVNTLSTLIGGRVSLNVVAGDAPEEQRAFGDYLDHDERYARTEEFLAICNGLWSGRQMTFEGKFYRVENARLNTPFVPRVIPRENAKSPVWRRLSSLRPSTHEAESPCHEAADSARTPAWRRLSSLRPSAHEALAEKPAPLEARPYLFIAGNSERAKHLAITQGHCWMQIAEAPDVIARRGAAVLDAGKELGVRMSIIGGQTRGEALRNAYELVQREDGRAEAEFVKKSDSVNVNDTAVKQEWLRPWLWTGAVKTHGTPSIAIVGSPSEIAGGIDEFRRAGVTQFILSGWPKLDSMLFFAHEVMPLLACDGNVAALAGDSKAASSLPRSEGMPP